MGKIKIIGGCFNTSHVAIYRKTSGPAKTSTGSFNTSHVAIYHATP